MLIQVSFKKNIYMIVVMKFSTILCFGFDRPMHLERMLNSLEKNHESIDSDVYICIDGPADGTDLEMHSKTVEVAKKNWNFKSTKLILREKNLDCRTNIINTITELFKTNDRLIILEDDLVLGPNFLSYMNAALHKYLNKKEMWCINGYSYPQLNFKSGSSVSKYVSPWGWGTWSDRWEIFVNEDYDKKNFISSLSENDRKKFNVENLYDWEDIIVKNELGKISAWDAYWYQAVFMNKGLTLYPNKSHIRNEGFDGTGMHCSSTNDWITPINMSITKRYPNKIKLNKLYMFNTLIFYRYYVLKRYLRFHKSKFSSFKNFRKFLRKKAKDIVS